MKGDKYEQEQMETSLKFAVGFDYDVVMECASGICRGYDPRKSRCIRRDSIALLKVMQE